MKTLLIGHLRKWSASHRPRPVAFAVALSLFIFGGRASAQVTAARVGDFLNSIGVCTHMTQGVDNPTNVAACLNYTGIRNLRDDGSTNASALKNWFTVHSLSGARVSLLPINGNITNSLYEYDQLAASNALLAVEGPNEPNNWPVTYLGQTSSKTNSLPIAWFQRDLYQAAKADPKLAGIPVFASSEAGGSEPNNCGLQFLTIPPGAGTLMPGGTVFADYANTHNYVCAHLTNIIDNTAWGAEDPALNGIWDGLYVEYGHTWWSPGYNGYSSNQLVTLPRVTTETGWVTSGPGAITEAQQGRLFLDLYLAAFKRGWSYTFIYMLHDDPGQGYWGFFHTDYTAKPSATFLHNLTTILVDKGSLTTPRSLNYSIPNEPATVHDLLLQKSDGTFELVVWGEQVSGSNNITVNFGGMIPMAAVYDPTLRASATETLTNVTSISLTLANSPLIIEIPSLVIIRQASARLHVIWPAGTLLESSNLAGPWSTNPASSPYAINPVASQEFFRLQ
jgi:hypothetical protein